VHVYVTYANSWQSYFLIPVAAEWHHVTPTQSFHSSYTLGAGCMCTMCNVCCDKNLTCDWWVGRSLLGHAQWTKDLSSFHTITQSPTFLEGYRTHFALFFHLFRARCCNWNGHIYLMVHLTIFVVCIHNIFIPSQITPASSKWEQSLCPHPSLRHLAINKFKFIIDHYSKD